MDIVTEKELVEVLHDNPATKITIRKKDGAERTFNCTLKVPEDYVPKAKEPRDKKPGLFVVWDLDKKAFRSFNFDQVLDVST